MEDDAWLKAALSNVMFVVTLDGEYKRVHKSKPKGKRKWAFRIGPIRTIETSELYGLPVEMEFDEAEQIAHTVAKRLGFGYIYVEP
jgi:hypothetical protein